MRAAALSPITLINIQRASIMMQRKHIDKKFFDWFIYIVWVEAHLHNTEVFSASLTQKYM